MGHTFKRSLCKFWLQYLQFFALKQISGHAIKLGSKTNDIKFGFSFHVFSFLFFSLFLYFSFFFTFFSSLIYRSFLERTKETKTDRKKEKKKERKKKKKTTEKKRK